ncbi:BZ3500_MvSof-1268-A1-R1_Chr5-2g07855 [Microbotryum saponariae]|uniref:BZ3500_MvSof-1268-A1-R1_Chr5-2g07855 protein n=1 Tax=Microbotryum saponariae TaxID=289078 RepID=A0A2X0LFE5_9BASI|nr:BZ3500_MvSof-1268-A1-R1_Chr5-2g07855 [Microbotryum saponariae]SDA05724.1 BZ3501_MvSof-1269-A2-R1_Chr5-2g07677 [Microbotryum saponariae]
MGTKTTLPGSLHAPSSSHPPTTNKLAFSSSPSASRKSSHILILHDSSDTSMLSSDDGDSDDDDAVIVTSVGDAETSAPRRDGNGSTNDGVGVEDVCLACRGECQCGGARGDPVFVSSLGHHGSSSRGSSPTSNGKAHPRFSGKTLTGSPAPASARGSPELGEIPKRQREDAVDETEEEGDDDDDDDDDDIGRPRLELQKIHNSHIAALPATLPPLPTLPTLPTLFTNKAASPSSRATSPKPTPSPPLVSASGTSTRVCFGTTTPQRLTLRQVLALSAKEAESASASAQSSVDGDALDDERYRKIADARALMKSQDPDSSDLSGEDDDDDGPEDVVMDEIDTRMEKSEEKALRKEIEEKKRRFGSDSDARSEARSEARSDRNKNPKPTKVVEETEEDVAAAWEANVEALNRVRARTLGEAKGGVVAADASIEIDEDDELGVTDLPIVGGSGVVTWSDYEDLDEFETIDTTDEEDANIVIPREEENIEIPEEQEKSLAMDLEEELEELLAISESVVGPIRHDELESGDMWFEAVSDVEADGGATADIENDGDSDDDDSDDDEDESIESGETLLFVDGIEGWTTAAGAMAALRRRAESGFESHDDEAETDDDEDEEGEEDDDDNDIDLLELDDDGGETTDSMASDALVTRFGAPSRKVAADFDDDSGESTDSDPEAFNSSNAVASTSSVVLTTEGDAKGKETSNGKGKEPAEPSPRAVPQDATTPQAPAMGVFVAKRKNRSTKKAVKVVVIDASTALVPSPFSRARKSQLDRLTRTTRADSKASTSTGSISGETVEAEVEIEVEFDLDELLNDDLLESLSPSSATSVSTLPTTGEKVKSTSKGLSDFARWSRVPIGAFRSRTTPHQVAFNYDGFDLVHGGTARTTLSSPGVPNYSTKRSVEKRMLTSPVMGPSSVSAKHGKKKGNNGHGNKRPKLGHNVISPFVAAPKNSPWL